MSDFVALQKFLKYSHQSLLFQLVELELWIRAALCHVLELKSKS